MNLAQDLKLAPPIQLPRARPLRAPRRISAKQRQLNSLQSLLTIVLGCGIPSLTLALSYVAGALWLQGQAVLAYGVGACILCVLCVSLTHVSEGIHSIARVRKLHSWTMAIAIDASLVVCELTNATVGVASWVCWGIIAGVAVVSAALNIYAFKLAQRRRRRKGQR